MSDINATMHNLYCLNLSFLSQYYLRTALNLFPFHPMCDNIVHEDTMKISTVNLLKLNYAITKFSLGYF